jgi:large subunit ribosomal protein L25
MTASSNLTAYPRDVIGKASTRLARAGRIPAVLYGAGRDSMSISVDRHDFELLMAHHAAGSTIVELELEGEKKPVNAMIRELQTSPLKGNIVHIDFLAVKMNVAVHAVVTLRFVNDPAGVKAGGVLTTNFHEVNVEAKPADLPEAIEVDVSALEVGDSLHLSDVVAPAGVTILGDPEEVLVSVQPPRLEAELEPSLEEGEVEVVAPKAEEE